MIAPFQKWNAEYSLNAAIPQRIPWYMNRGMAPLERFLNVWTRLVDDFANAGQNRLRKVRGVVDVRVDSLVCFRHDGFGSRWSGP